MFITDGWVGYDGLTGLGYDHDPVVLAGDPEKAEAALSDVSSRHFRHPKGTPRRTAHVASDSFQCRSSSHRASTRSGSDGAGGTFRSSSTASISPSCSEAVIRMHSARG